MYMNGLEIFCEHPELWSFDMERAAGPAGESIENNTAAEYACSAFLDVIGRDERLPLWLTGNPRRLQASANRSR